MGFNFLELINKYSQFQKFLNQTRRNPAELLEEEMRKRNISQQQLNDLISQAKNLQQLFQGGKK